MGSGSSKSGSRSAPDTQQPTDHKPRNSRPSKNHFTSEDLFGILQEEVELVIEHLLKKEISEQMEEKLKDLKIKTDQRERIHKKIFDDVQKQVGNFLSSKRGRKIPFTYLEYSSNHLSPFTYSYFRFLHYWKK